MFFDKARKPVLNAFIQAVVTVVADILETTKQEPSELAEKIGWNPKYFRGQTLAEWLYGDDQAWYECVRLLDAMAELEEVAEEPVELPPDARTPLYGSRPAEDYDLSNLSDFVHEVSAGSPDAFGQKRKLLVLALTSAVDAAKLRPESDRKDLAKIIAGWGAPVQVILS